MDDIRVWSIRKERPIFEGKLYYLGTARIVRQAYQGRISADLGIVGGKAPFPGIVDPLLKPHDLFVVVRGVHLPGQGYLPVIAQAGGLGRLQFCPAERWQ